MSKGNQPPTVQPLLPRRSVEGAEDAHCRVLILAPLGNDARLTERVLNEAGIPAMACPDLESLLNEASEGCGVLLMAEEVLSPQVVGEFQRRLAEHAAWAEMPVVVITGSGELALERRRRLSSLGPHGHVMLVERPFRPGTLVSTVEVALRSRERQYQVQALLQESVRQKEYLEFILRAGSLGDWRLDLATNTFTCSDTFKANFGVAADEELSTARLQTLINPADLERLRNAVRHAIESRETFELEYRITTPAGEARWIHAHGRVALDAEGRPAHLAGVTQNITERKAAERALEDQAALLREADRRKDEFVAMLAHELRNPLASVGSAVALLKETPEDAENRTWAVSVIERQNQQLARLVDDLLDVSRITRGKIELRRELLDAAECIDSACDAVAPLIADRSHTLLVEVPRGELWLYADPARLEQIVGNLLANAAKYTEPHGRIWLQGARDTGEVDEIVITVRDSGIGIPPHRIGEMFDLFAQGERTIARSEGGLGIGLTIVKSLCELHGGSVTAHSDGLGKGSVFTARLPAATAPARVERPSSAPEVIPPRTREEQRLLLVDDNVDTAQALGRLLRRRGYHVQLAFDGHSAVEAARVFKPVIVLLDIGLPGLDGYTVARMLRANECCANARIIALTGYGREEDRRLSRVSGFDHHLVKPVQFEELVELLATMQIRAEG